MKKNNKLWGIILSICIVLTACNFNVYAAGAGQVKLSGASGTVGSTVTVKGTISTTTPMTAAHLVISYDQSGLKYVEGSSGISGGSGSVQLFSDTVDNPVKSLSFSMKFQILKSGSFSINFGEVDVTDNDANQISMSKNGATVTGKAPTTQPNNNNNNNGNNTNNNTTKPENNKDSNNKLSSLQVYPGTLSPAFAAGTTSYNVTVPADTKEVTISAQAQSSKATVNVAGGKDLKLGINEAQVIVVAENGSSAAYHITIMCGEEEKVQMGDTEYTIDENFKDDQIPSGFTRTKVTYKEREYEGLVNGNGSLMLLGLKNEAGTTFYIYQQEKQTFYNFVQISIAEGKTIIPLPLEQDEKKFTETVALIIKEKALDAWKLNDECCVLPVLNEAGEKLLYCYDSVDATFQRYVEIGQGKSEPTIEEKSLFPNQYYMYAIVGLLGLVVILSIAMIYFVASRKIRHEGRKKKVLKKAEKQQAREQKQLEKQRRKEENMK